VARSFSYTQVWVSKGGKEFENFRKRVVFLVLSDKKQISALLASLEKLLEKSTRAPPWKKSFRRP